MTRLNWDASGERYYENGVDQGVLYVDDVGYVWNGLVSVAETPSGGEVQSYYLDGIKYLSLASAEEYEATINAFSAPAQFTVCDGVKSLYQGLFVTQQKRQPFGLSYRTKVGTDIDEEAGYRIHLVYNALAAPTNRSNKTLSDSPELETLSWFISAVPPQLSGEAFKPSAHFVVDSRFTPGEILVQLEDILYGSVSADARFPTQEEVLALFEANATVRVTDNGDGTFTVEGPDTVITDDGTGDGAFSITYSTAVFIDADSYTISSL